MKVKMPLALVVVLALAIGYLLGTESGRRRRDVILVKLGRRELDDAVEPTADDAAEPIDG